MRELPHGPIHGRIVTLRDPALEDVDGIVEACNDEATQRFLARLPSPYTTDDARRWITAQVPRGWAEGHAEFAVVLGGSDRIAGAVALGAPTLGGYATSLGYWTAPWARGRGVATDAARTLAQWAFGNGFGRIELTTHPANAASMRVAMAAGFTHEGVRRSAMHDGDRWLDQVVWSRLSTDSGEPMPRALPDLPGGSLADGAITVSPVRDSDSDDMYRLASLPEVIATTVIRHPPTPSSVAERCSTAAYRWIIGERATCAIRDTATGAFAGTIGLYPEPPTGQAMLGYSLVREWRGRGYARRAVRLLADWAFDMAGVARLVAGTAPDNIASQRTLSGAGFTREGYERARLPSIGGGRVDNISWALLPGERADPGGR